MRENKGVDWIDLDELQSNCANDESKFTYTPLRVVSWNILGDGLKLALSAKHDYCSLHLRQWKEGRCERTAHKILALDADIVCLQECLPSMFDDLTDVASLKREYVGFHMNDHLIHHLDEFLEEEESSRDSIHPNGIQTTTNSLLGQEEYGNAILLRRSLLSDDIVDLKFVKSCLFQTIGPQLSSTASSSVTGKARKRFLTLDCYGFIVMKLRILPRSKTTKFQETVTPVDIILIGTHLYWNPCDPHVKALQAEVLAQVAHICARGKLPTNIKGRMNPTENPCLVIIGGDFNSVPIFQPEFIATTEEVQALTALCAPTLHISIERLPYSFQQSGVFRLLTHGILESNHPEHPDTFGRGNSATSSKKKKMKMCGPMLADPFVVDSPTGFQMPYAYPNHLFTKADDLSIPSYEDVKIRQNEWPDLTTKVTEFEGVIDYIFWRFVPNKSISDASSNEKKRNQLLSFHQTEILRLPTLHGPIPDEIQTSDHLPVGMKFHLSLSFDC